MTIPLVGAGPSAPGVGGLVGLSNLYAWFQDDGPFYQESGRTTLATANGHPIGSWTDKSGNLRHLAAGLAGLKPALATGAINSLSAASFTSGINKFMALSGSPTLPITLYAVYFLSGTPADYVRLWEAADADEETYYFFLQHNASLTPSLDEEFTPATITAGSALVANTPAIVTGVFDGASSKIRVNNGSYATGTLAGLNLYGPGVRNTAASGVTLQLASLVVFAGGAVSAGDDTTVLGYLNSRYAVY